jgi:DNA-binding GntR family transcriptional regulator
MYIQYSCGGELDLNHDTENSFVQHTSLRDEVFQFLHSQIVAGKYARGEWLRQEEISTRLGVSQTPVREALDQLVAAVLAERVPYRGVRVLKLHKEEILDAYVMRLVLEITAVHLAAQNINPAQAEALYAIVNQTRGMVTLDDISSQRQLNKKFHMSIVAAGGNALLTRMYESVSNRFPDWMLYESIFRHPDILPSSLEREFEEHSAIAEAIAAHDGDKASKKIVEHIRNLGKELIMFLDISGESILEREQQIAPLWMGKASKNHTP